MLRLLVQNWEMKVLSLVVAAVVWFLVVSADRSLVAFAAPLEYVGVPTGMVLVGERRETVDVQIEAARWAVARLAPATVRVRVDLTGLRPGENTVPLVPDQVETPAGVAVTRITPAWVRVTLAEASVRSLRVVPNLRGIPAAEHTVHRVVVEPATVQLKGPRSTMEAQATVDTLPVDVTGSRQTITQIVGLALPEAVYPTTQNTVQVTVDIRAEDVMPQRRGTQRR